MLVLVTGAFGTLGRALLPALRRVGHGVRTFDRRGGDVSGDVRNAADVSRAVAGVDAIVHAAALHGIHLQGHPARDFWETNATGTFNVYDAAQALGVTRVVLCSTMGVYGRRVEEATVVDDDAPVAPVDAYGLSKALCEEIGATWARAGSVATVALRLGMFVPETWERYGFRLLFGGVDERDAADAVVRALAYDPAGGFEAMNVMAGVPFDDPVELARRPLAVLERHWPGIGGLGFAVEELVWGASIWRSDKARALLGWEPRHGFAEFLDEHRRRGGGQSAGAT